MYIQEKELNKIKQRNKRFRSLCYSGSINGRAMTDYAINDSTVNHGYACTESALKATYVGTVHSKQNKFLVYM